MIRNRTTVKPGLFLQPYVVSQLVGAVIEDVVEGSGVTGSEFAVTSWLGAVGASTPGELSRGLGLSPTTLSAMIERLVRKKQVRRTRHPEDGRSYVLELTARGKATNARNGERFLVWMTKVREELEGDPEEILDGMRRLEAALRATLDGRP
jgi:DNA-binding MarR family transcriptional regulator